LIRGATLRLNLTENISRSALVTQHNLNQIHEFKKQRMTTVDLGENPVHIQRDLPMLGTAAPGFTLTNSKLAPVSLSDFDGKWGARTSGSNNQC
jgi:hypothetical protein